MVDKNLIDADGDRYEATRVDVLYRYRVMDTPHEREYDEIAELAAYVADAPMAYIGFVDQTRQWFKSTIGFDGHVADREDTYCQYVMRDQKPLVILDTGAPSAPIPRHGIPSLPVPGEERSVEVRFYVGVPVFSREDQILGTLCVVDHAPRERVAPIMVEMMERLARQVSGQLEVRRANRRLYEERDHFSTLFNAAPTPLFLVRDGRIEHANIASAMLLTNSDPDGLRGVALSKYLVRLPGEGDDTYETSAINEMGKVIGVVVYVAKLHAHGASYLLVGIVDITDRREKEQVLREQRIAAENANRIKDTFLSLVSHDLKSPLSGIFTMLDLLDRAGDSFTQEQRTETIRDMRSAAAVLVEMVNQLLNIYRLQSGRIEVQLEEVPIQKSVEQVLLTLHVQIVEKRLTVGVDVDERQVIYADPGLLREALFNLVSNAVKFTPQGGVVRITSRERELVVEDSGPGVPQTDRAGIFRHEVRTSRPGSAGERGTGLGLPLVADIMRAHSGRVFLDERYTDGSRFVLDFALVETEGLLTDPRRDTPR